MFEISHGIMLRNIDVFEVVPIKVFGKHFLAHSNLVAVDGQGYRLGNASKFWKRLFLGEKKKKKKKKKRNIILFESWVLAFQKILFYLLQ